MAGIFVNKETVDEKFFIVQDPVFEEWHCGDNLDEIIHNIMVYAAERQVIEGVTAEEIAEKVKNIKEEDLRKVGVTFRKPDFGTNLQILSQSIRFQEGNEIIDPELYTMLRVGLLLVDWDIADESGEKVPLNTEMLRMLHPNIGRAIIAKLDRHIPHYREL